MIRLFTKTRRRKTRDGFSPSPLIRELDAAGYVRVTDAVTADQPSEITQAQFQGLVSGDGRLVISGPIASGEWVSPPSVFRLRLVGTGTLTLDARNRLGAVTTAVFTASATGATNQIEYPYAGDDASAIRATLTGSLICEVM